MSTHKSQIETKQNTPVSSKSFVSAWGEKKKQMQNNSKPVQNSPKKEIEVQVTFSWKFTAKEWNENAVHRKEIENDVKIVVGYDPISGFWALNDIVHPEVIEYTVNSLD
jgi:hypothetical protein